MGLTAGIEPPLVSAEPSCYFPPSVFAKNASICFQASLAESS
jgi:hypothetical protein